MCEYGEKSSALTKKPYRTKSKSPPILLGCELSCLTDGSDRHKNLLLMANLNRLTRSGKRTNNFLYPARPHLRPRGHICVRRLIRRNAKSGGVHYCPKWYVFSCRLNLFSDRLLSRIRAAVPQYTMGPWNAKLRSLCTLALDIQLPATKDDVENL